MPPLNISGTIRDIKLKLNMFMKDDDATPSGCFVIPELYFHMIMKVEHNTLLQYSQSFDFYQVMTLTKKSK